MTGYDAQIGALVITGVIALITTVALFTLASIIKQLQAHLDKINDIPF
jgi:outer membrane lipoprotein-sorting protein